MKMGLASKNLNLFRNTLPTYTPVPHTLHQIYSRINLQVYTPAPHTLPTYTPVPHTLHQICSPCNLHTQQPTHPLIIPGHAACPRMKYPPIYINTHAEIKVDQFRHRSTADASHPNDASYPNDASHHNYVRLRAALKPLGVS